MSEQQPPVSSPDKPSTKGGCIVVIGSLLVIGLIVATQCGRGLNATVTTWANGSADVAGTLKNTGRGGCSAPEITLYLRDHNGAIVRDFTFGTGELQAGEHRAWTTHMVGFLMVDAPVESSVRSITADASCTDKH